ncbi:uncharacterized protein LOC106070659 [Biomphalaria glabrata]|uniref:Uncharacterized protein LOC106070659 n=1 Tax=Biomphalaria glabrata TaxID=6526 RepID=A0A9W2YD92_BIOGL|nr:uncharacterized protein LOC106070659 [Biomphalaria glabrata]
MSLIEGIGDEVILILGIFTLGIILMLAWLSTHTADIPLLRDVGVIVVELSQRRVRPQNQDPTASATDLTDGSVGANVSLNESRGIPAPENLVTSSSEGENTTDGQRPVGAQAPDSLCNDCNEAMSSEASISVLQPHQSNLTETVNPVNINPQETESILPRASVVVEETSEGFHTTSDEHPTDEEIRRRRVQYFNTAHLTSQLDSLPSNEASNENELRNLAASTSQITESKHSTNNKEEPSNSNDSNRDSVNISQYSGQDDSLPPTLPEPEGSTDSRIRVKLKYMNETHRLVYASPLDTIGDFRRNNFQSELEDNKWVRFIYNGQDLRDDGRTLQACNISDNCTMHCLITSQTRATTASSASHDTDEDSFMGALMYPLFTFVLLIVWYFRLMYRQYFSAMSTVCLIGITFLLILSYISSLRSGGEQRPPQQAVQEARNAEAQNHQHVD